LLQTLEQTGQSDHTIVFAASDNGAEHRAYLPLRDSKRSIYEGGHRVPLVVRWPEHIREASTSHTPVCLNDVFATLAEIVDFDLPENAAEDSVSLLDLLLERQTLAARSSPVVHQSSKGDLAIRSRNWKLIFHRSGERELFDIDTDVGELVNVLKLYPETAEELTQQMQSLIDRGRSTPGPSQPNEHPLKLKSAGSN